MEEVAAAAALEQLLQEEDEIRRKVLRLKRIKNVIWLILWLIALTIALFMGFNHASMQPQALAEVAIPLLMGATLLTTVVYLAYIVLHVPVVRAIYDARKELYPRYNAAVEDEEQRPFRWSAYFAKPGKPEKSAKAVVFDLAAKAISLFVLVLAYQISWIHGIHMIGEELQNKHFAFMGFIDFALFSVAVLSVVVLITTRISSLASKKR